MMEEEKKLTQDTEEIIVTPETDPVEEPAKAPEAPSEETTKETTEEPTEETQPAGEPTGDDQPDGNIDGKALFNDVIDILETMLVSVFGVLLIFGYFMRPVTVEGRSMVPTLHNEDRLVMFRLLYQPKQGDVVVVDNQEGHILDADGNIEPHKGLNENIIKRVIAVSGQKVEVNSDKGEVYVDGVKLDEPYVNELTYTDDRAFSYPIVIPDGYIFVMGDNRNHSTDSRSAYVGLVSKEDVLGRAYFRYLPATPEEGSDEEKGSFGFIK
ncbi:MAG: signal peptidase I [Oscillospiraceae bacterium]|nr:signal peptidase I [Oscillospiraceae bacterium]